MIILDIDTFQGKKLIASLSEKVKGLFTLSHSSDDFISFDLPIGKMKCSTLNSGLTIVLIDLNENTPGLFLNFCGTDSEIPYKIGFCLKGSFQLDYPNENISATIDAGVNFIITPRPSSTLITNPNKPTGFLYIFISPEFIHNYFNITEKELKINLSKNQETEFLFVKGKNTPQINLALNDIFKDDYTGNLSKLMLESKALELLTLFFHQFVIAENVFSSAEKNSILNTHQYILSNLEKTITVKQLVSFSGLNEHKLQLGFKTLFGTTILKHIRMLRIQKARNLIMQNNFNVSEAAFSVGYTNLSHFAKAFKQEYGALPSEIKSM